MAERPGSTDALKQEIEEKVDDLERRIRDIERQLEERARCVREGRGWGDGDPADSAAVPRGDAGTDAG